MDAEKWLFLNSWNTDGDEDDDDGYDDEDKNNIKQLLMLRSNWRGLLRVVWIELTQYMFPSIRLNQMMSFENDPSMPVSLFQLDKFIIQDFLVGDPTSLDVFALAKTASQTFPFA